MSDEKQRLCGTVEHITFRNEQNGWTVLDLNDGQELHKVVGILPLCCVGDTVRLSGHFGVHASFGPQFEAEACEREQPAGAEAILRYLSSGSVKGIGPSTAAAIVDRFGDDALRVLEQEPERLAELRGISLRKARRIAEDYAEQFGLREVILAFSEYGVTPNEALRCWKRFGASTLDRVRQDPYVLCLPGLRIGFERADAICMAMQGDRESESRIGAGIQYVLRHNLQNGHTCLPEDKLIPAAASMLGVELPLVTQAAGRLAESGQLQALTLEGRRFLALPSVWRAESYAAERLRQMGQAAPAPLPSLDRQIDAIEQRDGIRYAARQRQAIHAALEGEILVLTGGPGTGKTTTLKAIIELLEKAGKTVVIGAPTGRAAKRAEELTGREAKTLHRLLEVQWDEDDAAVFARNEQNPLEADALVVDEVSMVDVPLCESLLRAVKPGCRLILVGDADQLPAVGAGCVLRDILRSGALPVVQLDEVFRQAMASRIVTNAHRIVRGELPELTNHADGDFFFLPCADEAATARTVTELCARRLPARYPYTVYNGIQVLCPGRKGAVGTAELNRRLQEAINPPQADKAELKTETGTLLRAGDKVMHTRNNYDIVWTRAGGESGTGVFNGDIGTLIAIDRREDTLTVRYDDRTAVYTREDAADLELAYAVTVHKSQGSEFDAVILPLFRTMPLLCYRNLLYTAVTRARSLLILVGERKTVEAMVQNDRKTLRYSALWALLAQKGGEVP